MTGCGGAASPVAAWFAGPPSLLVCDDGSVWSQDRSWQPFARTAAPAGVELGDVDGGQLWACRVADGRLVGAGDAGFEAGLAVVSVASWLRSPYQAVVAADGRLWRGPAGSATLAAVELEVGVAAVALSTPTLWILGVDGSLWSSREGRVPRRVAGVDAAVSLVATAAGAVVLDAGGAVTVVGWQSRRPQRLRELGDRVVSIAGSVLPEKGSWFAAVDVDGRLWSPARADWLSSGRWEQRDLGGVAPGRVLWCRPEANSLWVVDGDGQLWVSGVLVSAFTEELVAMPPLGSDAFELLFGLARSGGDLAALAAAVRRL